MGIDAIVSFQFLFSHLIRSWSFCFSSQRHGSFKCRQSSPISQCIQETPRALQQAAHDRFLPQRLLDVGPDDTGNHSVAATLTDPFLDFPASRGNNLRSIGLTAGCKWCLCAARWKEAVDHANSNVEAGDGAKA